MDYGKIALEKHKTWRGKFEIVPTCPVETVEDLSIAYTPGVAAPCVEIHKNTEQVYDYCRKWNLVAVVTDGTAVLGLGDIGPEAGMPVMEGKAVLFKAFGGVDAFPDLFSLQRCGRNCAGRQNDRSYFWWDQSGRHCRPPLL